MAQNCVLYIVQNVELLSEGGKSAQIGLADVEAHVGTLYVQEQPKNAPSISGGLEAAADVGSHSAAVNPYQIAILWAPADNLRAVQAFQLFLDDVLTIRRHGAMQLTITKKGAIALPRMEFTGPEVATRFLRVLRGYATFVEYPEDQNLTHVQSSPKPRRASATFLHLGRSFTPSHVLLSQRAASIVNKDLTGARKTQQIPQARSIRNRRPSGSSGGTVEMTGAGGRPVGLEAQDNLTVEVRKLHVGFAVLTQFAQVTKTVRDVGAEIGSFIDEGVRAISARGQGNIPPGLAANLEGLLFGQQQENRGDGSNASMEISRQQRATVDGQRSDNDDRQMPDYVRAEALRGVPVSRQAFLRAFSEETGTLADVLTMRQALFDGGSEPDARALVWPFLLDVYVWDLPAAGRESLLVELRKEYDTLKSVWQPVVSPRSDAKLATSAKKLHGNSGSSHLSAQTDQSGDLTKEDSGIQRPNETDIQMAWNILGQARDGSFCEIDVDLNFPSERLKEQSLQIAKDVLRTDRTVDELASDDSILLAQMTMILMTYGVRTPHIGYCQGMSDVLTPILYAMRNESEGEVLSFWCFTKLMDRISANFREDQSGIRSQLRKLAKLLRLADRDLASHFSRVDPDYHACFRWLLVQFKREFSFEAIPRLWEIMWIDFVAERELHLYIAVGLLIQQRHAILTYCDSFPELLRFVNDMSQRIDVDVALTAAIELFYRLGPVESELSSMSTSLRRGNSEDTAVAFDHTDV